MASNITIPIDLNKSITKSIKVKSTTTPDVGVLINLSFTNANYPVVDIVEINYFIHCDTLGGLDISELNNNNILIDDIARMNISNNTYEFLGILHLRIIKTNEFTVCNISQYMNTIVIPEL